MITKLNEFNADNEGEGEDESLFEMSNYNKKITGLPMIIWVSNKGRAKHGPRIKVQQNYNTKVHPDETFVVSISDNPKIVAGEKGDVSTENLNKIYSWITINKDALIMYWNYEVTTNELEELLIKVE